MSESLVGLLGQCPTLTHLNFDINLIGEGETESFAGVLVQCTDLAHLDFNCDSIGDAVAEGLEGVLGQCASLTHLDLSGNIMTSTLLKEDSSFSGLHWPQELFRETDYPSVYDNRDDASKTAPSPSPPSSLTHVHRCIGYRNPH